MKGRFFALIVYTNKYKNFEDLLSPKEDAEVVKNTLIQRGYKDKNIQLCREPTMNELDTEIKKFYRNRKLTSHDTLLFYYSGHGELALENDSLLFVLK
ncbi:MAG: caspase family protein, partial [Candidatus Electrothrix sp. AS4_5]|nr:caspase family protein [Candidatus Electrothrix gigas]